jgi:5-(carboxyamino)imidazole ribonucleotide synthase
LKFSNVGIVGAGQLGRMMALAGYPLGIRCSFLDTSPEAPAAQVAPILVGPLEDPALLEKLASQSDVLTFDWENIAGRSLAPLERLTQVRPPRAALEASQDRLHEKALFRRLRIPVAAHAAVDARGDLERAVLELGVPGVLKTRRLGYDGKGQFLIDGRGKIAQALSAMGEKGLIYEQFQAFSREVSIVGARSGTGEIVSYPLSANTHASGILRHGIAPFASSSLERSAKIYLKRIMSALDYVGVLAVEFFVVNGRLVAN